MVAHREDCEAGCLIGMLARHTLGSGKTPQRRLAPLGPSWRGASLTVIPDDAFPAAGYPAARKAGSQRTVWFGRTPTTRPPIADQRPPLVHALPDLTLLGCLVPE